MNHLMKRFASSATCAVVVAGGCAAMTMMAGCNDGTSSSATPGAGSMTTVSADAITMEFDVKGMSCEGCVFAVRSAIAELDGVEACDVSLADERAVVAVRDATTERQIIEAIVKLDFTISRRGAGDPSVTTEPAADASGGGVE